jgi:hypothetical protein
MPSEGWKTLLTEEWASCVRIHNLPNLFKNNFYLSISSVSVIKPFQELQISAETWNPSDFKELSNHSP